MARIQGQPADEQRAAIAEAGHEPIGWPSKVQFRKYAFVAHDLFVKHLSLFVSGIIDVGIEILPMKRLEREMSPRVSYYERDLLNGIRQGRGVPAVPLVLI